MRPAAGVLLLAACGGGAAPGDIRPELVGHAVEIRAEGRQWMGLVEMTAAAARSYREREGAPRPHAVTAPQFLLVVGVTRTPEGEFLNGRLVDVGTGVVTCAVTLRMEGRPQDRRALVEQLVAALLRRPGAEATGCRA